MRGQAERSRRQRVRWSLVRKIGHPRNRNGLRARLRSLLVNRHPWWDWGHRLMILVGSDMGGNWSTPEKEVPTWWYRQVGTRRMWRTGYPRPVFEVVKDYDEFHRLIEGLNDDEMYAWSALNVSQDGELQLGKRYWGGRFYGLPYHEQRLLRRYLRMARRHTWWGLRPWLYYQGLHAAIYNHRPFTCAATPPKGQGGYDHWFCELKRRHDGMHRVGNYVWGEVGGEPIGTHYVLAGTEEKR